MTDFKPMLAGKFAENKVQFPVVVQAKLDGIRATVVNGKLLSRSLKPIPNRFVRSVLEQPQYEGFDGELIVGDPTAEDCFRQTTSGCMREDGEPSFVFYVFDLWNRPTSRFADRYIALKALTGWNDAHVVVVPNVTVFDLEALYAEETRLVERGYEGAILRNPDALYKFGRGSATKGDLLKLKRFVDFEAEVVGYEEEYANLNEAKTNALGHTERSSAKAGKVGKGRLGKLICIRNGVQFGVGTGFDAQDRIDLWAIRDTLPGRWAKIKSFPVGEKDAPRHPVWLGFRAAEDMS